MTRRSAVTLMEVLIAMFIMAIGMLALMALFPVGAVSMAQALKDDRCASTAAMAENVAIALDIRHDANVATAAANVNPLYGAPGSQLIYVDPYSALTVPAVPALPPFGQPLGATVGYSPGIPRVYPAFAGTYAPTTQYAYRWFSLPDDIAYNLSGTADTSATGGTVDRGRRYSYAYLLRWLPPTTLVQLYVVVFRGRSTGVISLEQSYTSMPPGQPIGIAGTNVITLPVTVPNLRRGGWIFDSSYNAATGQVQGNFYRVTNITEFGATSTVELQSNLLANVTQATIMDNVVEVFDKGTSWQP